MIHFDLLIAFVAGFVAAFVGSMAGGGAGFFAFYTLLVLGLPINIAIATNKFGDVGFFPAALRNLAKKGLVKKKIFMPLIILEAVGVIAGTFLLINLSETAIKIIVTIITLPVFLLMLSHSKKDISGKANPLWKPAYLFAAFYGGILQVATGFFKMFALMDLRKIPALESAANSWLVGFPFAILSVIILIHAGLVDIRLGVPLFIGNIIGAHLGSKIALKKGNRFVRYMLLSLMFITLIVIWIR